MKKNNPVNIPLHAVTSVSGIYGWYVNAAKDSLSLWIMVVLSILYITYCFFEYVAPKGIESIAKLITKLAKYGLSAVLFFISIYLAVYLVAPTFAETNKTVVSIYNPKKLTEIEKKVVPKKVESAKIQTWNEIIDSNDSCNITPLIVKEISGITEKDARRFLSSLPHLDNRQRFVNVKDRNTPYLYWYSTRTNETWNKDEEYMQEVSGMKGNYNQLRQMSAKTAEQWSIDGYKQSLAGYKKSAFQTYDIRPDSPFIVLFHKYNSPNTNGRYEKRFKTYETLEYHTFIFRKNALDSFFEKNIESLK